MTTRTLLTVYLNLIMSRYRPIGLISSFRNRAIVFNPTQLIECTSVIDQFAFLFLTTLVSIRLNMCLHMLSRKMTMGSIVQSHCSSVCRIRRSKSYVKVPDHIIQSAVD